MKISDLRSITKMSQRQFAEYFGIPVGTLRNWEQGISRPPEYVFGMIFTSMRRDKMINIETIKFVRMLDELASLSKNGIEPFENANESTVGEKVFYDADELDEVGYKVVWETVCDEGDDLDILCYYDSDTLEYKVRVRIVGDEPPFILVILTLSGDVIVIEDGTWYFS